MNLSPSRKICSRYHIEESWSLSDKLHILLQPQFTLVVWEPFPMESCLACISAIWLLFPCVYYASTDFSDGFPILSTSELHAFLQNIYSKELRCEIQKYLCNLFYSYNFIYTSGRFVSNFVIFLLAGFYSQSIVFQFPTCPYIILTSQYFLYA